ncbi:MAG TPA: hypothetical protein VGG19_14285 [Tepidisphaeraceae bacterium]
MSEIHPPASESGNKALTGIFVFLIVLGGVVRGYHVQLLPMMSDSVRQLYYAQSILRIGPAAASKIPMELNPAWRHITGPWQPYIYPPLTLVFFLLFALTWPTLFAIKLTLTLIEAVNAILLAKLTGNKWIGVIYWLCPISIFWVSHQAQYEPAQNLLVLLALWMMRKNLPAALALTVLAIELKVMAFVLLPLVLIRINRQQLRVQAWAMLAGALALIPFLIGEYYYPFISNFRTYGAYNDVSSYFWNPWDPVCSHIPLWQLIPQEIISDALVVILFIGVWKSRYRLSYIPAILFMVIVKFHKNMMPWYLVAWPCFLVPIPERWVRNVCVILWPFLDVVAIYFIVCNVYDPRPHDMIVNGIVSVFQRL